MDLEAELERAKRITNSRERAQALATLLRQTAEITSVVMAERDEAARAMKADGYTGREIMEALGLTKGRVSQLLREAYKHDA